MFFLLHRAVLVHGVACHGDRGIGKGTAGNRKGFTITAGARRAASTTPLSRRILCLSRDGIGCDALEQDFGAKKDHTLVRDNRPNTDGGEATTKPPSP